MSANGSVGHLILDPGFSPGMTVVWTARVCGCYRARLIMRIAKRGVKRDKAHCDAE